MPLRAVTSCSVQPRGSGPAELPPEADADAAAAIDMPGVAPGTTQATADGLAEGAGVGEAPAARAGPNVQLWVAAGAQAASPAAATRPPPVRAALRRNLRRERATSFGSVVGRLSCGMSSMTRWWRLASAA